MKRYGFRKLVSFVLAVVTAACTVASSAVLASNEESGKSTLPHIKAATVYADEALTEKIDDLSTLKAGEKYYYTVECEKGEMLKSVGIANGNPKYFIARCDGKDAFALYDARILRPCDVDLNAKINAKDVTLTMRLIIGVQITDKLGSARDAENCDCNLDGKINAKDVVTLMKRIIHPQEYDQLMADKLSGGVQKDFVTVGTAGYGGFVIPSTKEAPDEGVYRDVATGAEVKDLISSETAGITDDSTRSALFSLLGVDNAVDDAAHFAVLRSFPAEPRTLEGSPADADPVVYIPRRAVISPDDHNLAVMTTMVELVAVRLESDRGVIRTGEGGFGDTVVVYDPSIRDKFTSTIPVAILFDGCYEEHVSYEIVERVSVYEYLGCEREISDSRAFGEVETDYAFDMLRATVAAKGEENVMISPLSFQLCFALAANGAKGETLSGIETLAGLRLERMNGELADFARTLKVSPDERSDISDRFNVANSVWFKDSGLTVNGGYVQAIKNRFDAYTENVPFDGTTVKRVNDWVDDETYGMIKDLFERFPENTKTLLVNAVAFEGQWSDPFEESATTTETFHGSNGDSEVQMLNQTATMKYFRNSVFRGFVKPYVSHYAFVAILPDGQWALEHNTANAEFDPIAELDSDLWSSIFKGAYTAEVTVKMPKFRNEYRVSVTEDLLKDKALPAFFDPDRADLSGMAISDSGNLYASTMEQATFIELDEKGTRAAAVTYALVADCAAPDYPERSVILDRPFIYAIIDTNTNIPIFVGTLTSVPNAAE